MNRNKPRIFPFQKIKVIQGYTNNRYLFAFGIIEIAENSIEAKGFDPAI